MDEVAMKKWGTIPRFGKPNSIIMSCIKIVQNFREKRVSPCISQFGTHQKGGFLIAKN